MWLRHRVVALVAAAGCVAGGAMTAAGSGLPAAAAASATAGGRTWGNALEVPGTAALNAGGSALVTSVSCPSMGNCTVGGQYADQAPPAISGQAFVADEVNGIWGSAIEVPGTAALNTGDYAYVTSVSCPSAGNCAAVGEYCLSSCSFNGDDQAFVADEVNGTWGDAIEIPGTAALNTGNGAQAFSVSCPSAGNCAAGGLYTDSSGSRQAFVADEVNGTWGNAIEVPGTAALNTFVSGEAEVASVSCPSAGDCAVGGSYTDSTGNLQAFVANEVNGTWAHAIEVPGTAALNTGGNAGAEVSCASAGNCVAAGSYSVTSSSGPYPNQAFVANEVNGTWGNAIEVPGTAALNTGGIAGVDSVSCPSVANCVAAGEYAVTSGTSDTFQVFVVSEVNGTWGDAVAVPGTAASATTAGISLSCPSVGNCAAGGYTGTSTGLQAFVVNEVNGTWGDAVQVPGLNTPAAVVDSVSCPLAGTCVAAGEYDDSISGGNQAFVVSQNCSMGTQTHGFVVSKPPLVLLRPAIQQVC